MGVPVGVPEVEADISSEGNGGDEGDAAMEGGDCKQIKQEHTKY